jgi:hypothetical protein
MKLVPLVSFVAGIIVATPAFAVSPSVPAELLNGCNQKANQMKLKGPDRQAYVDKCTAPATVYPSTGNTPVPQELTAACNQEANQRKLKGGDRDSFVKSCETYKNTLKLTAPAIPKEKINSCVDQANAKKLKGDDRKAFVMDCLE